MLAALGAVSLVGCSSDDSGPDAQLRVRNDSDFVIDSIQVTPSGSSTWGPNLLDASLDLDQTLLVDVNCGTYDALLIDETGTQCEVDNLDLCGNRADWVITNDECPVFAAARAARKAAAAAAAGSSAGSSTPAAH